MAKTTNSSKPNPKFKGGKGTNKTSKPSFNKHGTSQEKKLGSTGYNGKGGGKGRFDKTSGNKKQPYQSNRIVKKPGSARNANKEGGFNDESGNKRPRFEGGNRFAKKPQDNKRKSHPDENEDDSTPVDAKVSKKQKLEQKKQMKPNYELMKQIKALWETARNTTIEKKERDPVIARLMSLIQGKIHDVTFKHDASRIVQTCVKFGTDQNREQIVDELKGSLVELSKSHYGHFLVMKMLKYTKSKRAQIMKEFNGHVYKLLKHKEAAPVIEYMFNDISNAHQRSMLMMEFYGPEFALFKEQNTEVKLDDIIAKHPEKKTNILKHLYDNISKIVDKGAPLITHSIVHHLIYDFLRFADHSQISDIVALLRENLVHFVHTREGAKVGVQCVQYASAKDRKVIIKGFKGYVAETCKQQYGHWVILRLLDVVDDTVLVGKAIVSEMVKHAKELVTDKSGSLCFLQILAPGSRKYFPQSTLEMLQPITYETVDPETGAKTTVTSSKKAPEVRQQELLSSVSGPMLDFCEKNVELLISDPCGSGVLLETLKAAQGDKSKIFQTIAELAGREEQEEEEVNVEEEAKKIHPHDKASLEQLKAKAQKKEHVLVGYNSSRLLSTLTKGAKNEEVIDASFAPLLAEHIKNKHQWAAKKGSSFVILSLLQTPATKAQVTKELKPHLKNLSKVDEPGCKIIVETLKK